MKFLKAILLGLLSFVLIFMGLFSFLSAIGISFWPRLIIGAIVSVVIVLISLAYLNKRK